jgi:uncharacterized protein (DUF2141 family)
MEISEYISKKKANDVQVKILHIRFFTPGCLLLLIFTMISCAKVGMPTGGEGDVNPPELIKAIPPNKSTSFDEKEIELVFDEFIKLNNPYTELLISPPLKNRPGVRIKNKSIMITLNNELLPQTTYTLNFGNAIADIHEGNVLPDFEYIFATGGDIDSLSIIGKVLNAFDQKPSPKKEEVMVMLYDNLADSFPLIEIPRYLGKANEHGLFSVNNIHQGRYRVIALKDLDGDMLYDPVNEYVAFLDSLIVVNETTIKPTSFIKDTIKIITQGERPGNTGRRASRALQPDTVISPGKKLNAIGITLHYFQEKTSKVYITAKRRESPEKIFLTFNRPPYREVKIKPLNFTTSGNWFIKESSRNADTLTYWLTDSLLIRNDTLLLSVEFTTVDSSRRLVNETDTIIFRNQQISERNISGRRGRNVAEKTDNPLSLTANIANKGILNLNKPIIISSGKPLGIISCDDIELYQIKDSLTILQKATCTPDSINIRKLLINCEWEENSKYKLFIKPGAVKDIYGQTNDTMRIEFATQKEDYYGRILVTVSGGSYPLILQILDQKGKIVGTSILNEPEIAQFDFMPPGKYSLKAIVDKNGNGEWDTGNFLSHIQPEQVFINNKPIELRSNWDYEVSWIISE